MRNATIFVANLRGVATETVKNIVLAGIGKLIIWDCEDVAAEDLGVGFFFRDEDIGKKVHLKKKKQFKPPTHCPAHGLTRSTLLVLSPTHRLKVLTAILS